MEDDQEPTQTEAWHALMRAAERERVEEEAAADAAAQARSGAGGARGAVTRSELFGLRVLRDRLLGEDGEEKHGS